MQKIRNDTEQFRIQVQFYMACARGAIDGFSRGLYKNESEGIPNECMSATTVKDVVEVKEILQSGDILKLFQSVSLLYQLAFIFEKECKVRDITYEVSTWCLRAEGNPCKSDKLINNFSQNIFVLAEALTEASQIIYEVIIVGGALNYADTEEAEL